MRINPFKLFVGSFIPNWLLVRPEISDCAKLVYARLCQFAGENGLAYPRLETIAVELGKPVRNISRAIAELKEHKLIESTRRGLGQSNYYYFLDHNWMRGNMADAPPAAKPEWPPVANQPRHQWRDLRESPKENQSKREVHASRAILRNDLDPIDPLYAGARKQVI